MRLSVRGFVLFPFVLAVVSLACSGSPKPPPIKPDTVAADPDAGAPASASEGSGAAGDGGGASDGGGAVASSDPGSSSGSTPLPKGVSEPPDDCTPVGVDFEKRARPKLKECYREGKAKDKNLKGTVKITVEVDTLGKIKSTKIVEKTLPEPVAQCMLKVVKATPFTEASKCPGKSITIPLTFPTPP